MMILLFSVLNDEQRALVERIFHEHHIHFQRISFNIVKSEEAAEDVVSTAFIKIMDNIEKISDLPCPQMTAFCVTIVKNASIDVLRQLQQRVHIDYWDNISDEDTDDIADECIHNADVHRLTEGIDQCALPGFVDSKNEEKTERNAGYLVVSQSGGGMLRQGTREGIRRTPANRGMRAHRVVKGLDISEDVCHGLCP